MTRDPEKRRAKYRRYHERKKIAKYGEAAAGIDMRGRHGNHAHGERNGRFNAGRLLTSQGYVLVRVTRDHPRAFGPPGLRGAYAYQHDLVAEETLGRHLRAEEAVHHHNGQRDDNRPENLEVTTRSDHARGHAAHPDARDEAGRFKPGRRSDDPAEEDLRVREFQRL
jgi:hypothetical protein